MDITIVIPCFNEQDVFGAALAAIITGFFAPALRTSDVLAGLGLWWFC